MEGGHAEAEDAIQYVAASWLRMGAIKSAARFSTQTSVSHFYSSESCCTMHSFRPSVRLERYRHRLLGQPASSSPLFIFFLPLQSSSFGRITDNSPRISMISPESS